jgi:glutamate/tyrosine decarboxylase-like PLP-dependent enzyme
MAVPESISSLDPANWSELRQQGHKMLDDMFDYLENVSERPVWQPIPDAARLPFSERLPAQGSSLDSVHQVFMEGILPYAVGNAHPGFMGWVHGGGTPVGMLAEMLAAGLNANLGGRNQIPVEVERQIVRWMAELFGFPEAASGLFVTGTSAANLIGVLIARRRAFGVEVRDDGTQTSNNVVAYTSAAAHGCIEQAMDIAGLGRKHLRKIPILADGTMNLAVLQQTIAADRAAGLQPFLVVGTAGSVDIGAIDDLDAIAALARREQLHFHVDGAFGAMAMLSPTHSKKLKGIELADTIAMDFHKWLQVPYDAGFLLARDGELHLSTFDDEQKTYLARDTRGIAAGSPWPCDLGPDLSRSFRALKTWFTIKVYGADKLAQVIDHSCELAHYLEQRINADPMLEMMAPVNLNIVCFRLRCPEDVSDAVADAINRELLIAIQESGAAAPSSTKVNGRLVIRAALFNHRSTTADMDKLLAAIARLSPGILAAHTMSQNTQPSLQDLTPQFDPDSPYLIGLAKLLTAAYFDIDLGPIGNTLIQHLQSAPDDHKAMMDLSTILYIRGNDEVAAATQLDAIQMQQLYHLPTAADGKVGLRLLALMVTGDFMANTPLEFMLTGSDVALDVLYVKPYGDLPTELPPHDVLFLAVGESDMTRDLLEELCEAVEGWDTPLLNHPKPSLDLSRDRVGELLQDKPELSIPLTARIDRYDLGELQNGSAELTSFLSDGAFPLIIRPIGSHAGKGLEKLITPADIGAYLETHDGDEFFISRFVDYSSTDGLFRKYRIVLIEGRPFLCHMAISENWMVHYLNANMTGENSFKRDEEAAVMRNFDQDFVERHQAAFDVLNRSFPLDYYGLDCAETKDGRLLIFEVDTGMIVHAMDPVDMFPYKQDNMRNVFAAFQSMLHKAKDSAENSGNTDASSPIQAG